MESWKSKNCSVKIPEKIFITASSAVSCIAHCPVYKELLVEEATPRGKVQLSRYLSEGSLDVVRGGEGGVLLHLPVLRILRGQLSQRRPRRPSLFRRALAGRAALRHRLEEEDDVPASGQQVEDVHIGLVRPVGPQDVRRSLDRIENERGRAERGADSGLQ